jgi:hypothetical protein
VPFGWSGPVPPVPLHHMLRIMGVRPHPPPRPR